MNITTESSKSVWEIVNTLVQEMKQGKLELPVLPQVVSHIQEALADPDISLDKIARTVEKDAAISARLMAIANTSYYARAKKAKTVKEAILRLGEKETSHIVIAVANRSLFRTRSPQFKKLMEHLWRHSLATAHSARMIADQLEFKNSEKPFFMGLLHDIGKTIILQKLTERPGISKTFDADAINQSMHEAHLSIGGVILRKWRFEKDFVRVATLHEGPKFYPPVSKSVLIVNLANALTRKIGYSLITDDGIDLIDLDSARRLNLSPDILGAIRKKTETLMKSVEIN
ncbi:MAG: HDOD domain-containing protein [Thermodesulfobacteriota bacterium]|nr:HDOD domain-containing protein [Thermodesulfobacteriota bacterium]